MYFKRKRKPVINSTSTCNPLPKKMLKILNLTPSRIKDLLLMFSLSISIFLVFRHPQAPLPLAITTPSPSPTLRKHLLFSIASSSNSFPLRSSYIRLWYTPLYTRAIAFLDQPVSSSVDPTLPPIIVSGDTKSFPYTFKGGLRSAIRVARVVKEAVDRNETGIRWLVFGDDDTVFIVDNLVKVLSKYDHDKWYYVGSNSESYEQNLKYSFDMAFGGGGFAISYSLGKVVSRVLDSCLMRYAHLYGSDARIWSCLAELGVSLTHESGFHQVDMRGNFFGMLAAHPLSPLLSLHHLDALEPIFPNMSKTHALEHFFKAVNVDSSRILQQTVCYDHFNSLTVSVAWGYAIQVYEGNQLLPDLLSLQKTFSPWKRGANVAAHFMFNTREFPRDSCRRPLVFFLDSVLSDKNVVWSNYTRHSDGDCLRANAIKNLKDVKVVSQKLELDAEQMMAPRRQCCEILPSYNESMVIKIRKCGVDELISMNV
ncbi:uncharacterized protein LOC111309236 [Durio zibethinus]|uniref:Uncharacterized protein LOC111309236 n=1 Tax=Durio zibethinus TaxID=66656 RepID=A0A6P6AGH2_DURZI|nr:uncharacterized protein LOC111309236 [Durio zibethinus]XP_022763968.1 uncharacterized protein LOC111309236 [Durio zibethinus]XP_022763969.1 uncharacterized protein LOC111309236 [Durio zibethinus]